MTDGLRMLIVDDEEGMRNTLRRIMMTKGFEVRVATDGSEAISIAEEFQPQILLMDIRMPGMNGVEAFREIKTHCPDAVAVFMTAYSSSELSQEAIDEGAVEVLAKPLDIDTLCDLIQRPSSSRPLLIVDDDEGFRVSLKRVLTSAGSYPEWIVAEDNVFEHSQIPSTSRDPNVRRQQPRSTELRFDFSDQQIHVKRLHESATGSGL